MLLGIENLAVFVGTGILLNLYPGPDTLYIIGRSLSQGRSAGVAAALGIGTGSIVHTLLGAFGLSAIITASATAFLLLKYAGCVYLIYQGVQLLRSTPAPESVGDRWSPRDDLLQVYRQGAVTNILNPKVALFFLAFLPQFISLASPNKPLSFIILGALFVTTGTIWCLLVALFSAALSRRLRQSPGTSRLLRRINGLLFLGLGFKLATAQLEA
ncbi:LysE family translocator [Desulfofustis glycolicus]|uniref:Threonine/homoserine/homoserine lactone efflux protein n=1 Tax=Desulfofustis glycolicus DSM 9705 TaxID=1121409 RepID=A0A1M5V1M1_9BACT|nr:LysE family translocator [Desulfofustis glycolicus]SHH68998.1 Threonine/homoserine/homoserine lactone efflux protein [Desulfofustis glycolicus DSM 9705]